MAKLDYEKVKKQIEEKHPDMDVDEQVKELRSRLMNLSPEGALLILANKAGIKIAQEQTKATLKRIESLRDGDDFVEICGAVVNVYDIKFYEVCPACAKRVREHQSGTWKCAQDGIVEPAYSYLMNLSLDDGTGYIRVTLFSRQIEKLLGMNTAQILKFRDKSFEETKMALLGKLLAFRGNAKLESYNNKLAFTSKLVFKEAKDVEPRAEALSNLIQQAEKIPPAEDDDLESLDEELVM